MTHGVTKSLLLVYRNLILSNYYTTCERLYFNGLLLKTKKIERLVLTRKKKYQYCWKRQNIILENLFTRIGIRYNIQFNF